MASYLEPGWLLSVELASVMKVCEESMINVDKKITIQKSWEKATAIP